MKNQRISQIYQIFIDFSLWFSVSSRRSSVFRFFGRLV